MCRWSISCSSCLRLGHERFSCAEKCRVLSLPGGCRWWRPLEWRPLLSSVTSGRLEAHVCRRPAPCSPAVQHLVPQPRSPLNLAISQQACGPDQVTSLWSPGRVPPSVPSPSLSAEPALAGVSQCFSTLRTAVTTASPTTSSESWPWVRALLSAYLRAYPLSWDIHLHPSGTLAFPLQLIILSIKIFLCSNYSIVCAF